MTYEHVSDSQLTIAIVFVIVVFASIISYHSGRALEAKEWRDAIEQMYTPAKAKVCPELT